MHACHTIKENASRTACSRWNVYKGMDYECVIHSMSQPAQDGCVLFSFNCHLIHKPIYLSDDV